MALAGAHGYGEGGPVDADLLDVSDPEVQQGLAESAMMPQDPNEALRQTIEGLMGAAQTAEDPTERRAAEGLAESAMVGSQAPMPAIQLAQRAGVQIWLHTSREVICPSSHGRCRVRENCWRPRCRAGHESRGVCGGRWHCFAQPDHWSGRIWLVKKDLEKHQEGWQKSRKADCASRSIYTRPLAGACRMNLKRLRAATLVWEFAWRHSGAWDANAGGSGGGFKMGFRRGHLLLSFWRGS